MAFFTLGRPPLQVDDERFVQLQQAINRRSVVYLHYHAQYSNRISAREVEPLHLDYVDNVWLLHGYCRLRQDYRNFRLDRIDYLVVRDEIFPHRPTKQHGWPEDRECVLVRFNANVVRWVREVQHSTFSGEMEEDEEGAMVMAYKVPSYAHITRWLLSWGDGMEVLEPAELRTLIAQTAAQIATQHA